MTTQTTKANSDFDVKFASDFVLGAIAGARGPGQKGRPFILDTRYFKINTKENGTVINTYVIFGGIPTKKIHEKLCELGFNVRRRPAAWTGKDKKVHPVDGNQYELYAVYYHLDVPTEEQLAFLSALTIKGLTYSKEKGKTFLLPSWEAIDKNWGDRQEWLQICTVTDEPEEEDDPVVEDDDDLLDDDFDL